MSRLAICASLLSLLLVVAVGEPAAAQSNAGVHAKVTSAVAAPPGFRDACSRYGWLCANRSARATMSDEQLLAHAQEVNRHVNGSVTEVSDLANYGVPERWSLPYNGRGDCEDFALLKKKMLLDRGVDPRRLMMAVALDRRGDNHAVLLVRLNSGDVVLDNLNSRIVPWSRTGYTFLAKQMSSDKSSWGVLLSAPVAQR